MTISGNHHHHKHHQRDHHHHNHHRERDHHHRDQHYHHQSKRQQDRERKLESLGLTPQGESEVMLKAKQELPKYYNPNQVNALTFSDQMKKRKMLWAKKSEENPAASSSNSEKCDEQQQPQQQQQQQQLQQREQVKPKQSFNKWEETNLGDNAANEKFRRLMGIKSGGGDTNKQGNLN